MASRTKSSQRWLRRQQTDPFVAQAVAQGYRSRAAFKLLALQERDRILRPGFRVVDLGSAPGGWSQVARAAVGSQGVVVAVDVLPMDPLAGVDFVQGDFTQAAVLATLETMLQAQRLDLVISDMAPNFSGVKVVDQARSTLLGELALDFAQAWLRPGGALVIKAFQGEGFDDLLRAIRQRFEWVGNRKPEASRKESREIYLVAKGFQGTDVA